MCVITPESGTREVEEGNKEGASGGGAIKIDYFIKLSSGFGVVDSLKEEGAGKSNTIIITV